MRLHGICSTDEWTRADLGRDRVDCGALSQLRRGGCIRIAFGDNLFDGRIAADETEKAHDKDRELKG